MVDMLVSNNVQWSMGKSAFVVTIWGSTQSYLSKVRIYIEDAIICVIICKFWTASCLHCPIATVKVLFAH